MIAQITSDEPRSSSDQIMAHTLQLLGGSGEKLSITGITTLAEEGMKAVNNIG
jgi:hypothetical protein